MSPGNRSKNPLVETSADSVDLLDTLEELGALSLSADPLTTSARLRQNVLHSVASGDVLAGYADRVATFFDIDSTAARALLAETRDVHGNEWTDDEHVAGVRTRLVAGGPRVAGAECALVHMPAGSHYPEHRHLGDEWCFFLGGYGLEAGHEWNPGDLILNPAGSHHAILSAVSPEPFILAVVVHEGIEVAQKPRSRSRG